MAQTEIVTRRKERSRGSGAINTQRNGTMASRRKEKEKPDGLGDRGPGGEGLPCQARNAQRGKSKANGRSINEPSPKWGRSGVENEDN